MGCNSPWGRKESDTTEQEPLKQQPRHLILTPQSCPRLCTISPHPHFPTSDSADSFPSRICLSSQSRFLSPQDHAFPARMVVTGSSPYPRPLHCGSRRLLHTRDAALKSKCLQSCQHPRYILNVLQVYQSINNRVRCNLL